MIKKITFLLLFVSFFAHSQIQYNTPWMQDLAQKKGTNALTIDEISKSAEAYFATIDRDKKGSGLKPFERWKYHWSFYTDKNGAIKPASDLWKAWEIKNQRNKSNSEEDQSNWSAVGPFQSSNTYSSPSFKSSGQGRINVIAVDPSNSNTYYVGAPAGGIWKSLDAGKNWSPLTDYLPQIGVSGIAIHPTDSNIIYIATGDDDAGDSYAVGVWKTIDGGTTWNNTGNIPGNPNIMNDIYIDPNNPDKVIVATSTGIQKTINGGTTWNTTLSISVSSTQTNIDLKMKPGDPNTFYVVARDKFWKSTDGGDSFVEKTITGLTSSSRLAMDVTIANDSYIYIVSYLPGTGPNDNGFNGIYKSTDSGETFTRTSENSDIFNTTQAWYDLSITASASDAETVYVGVLDIWKSTDGGNDFSKITIWHAPDTKSFVHADIHFLRFIDGKFFAGTDGGVYFSTDEGESFTDLTETLSISQFYKISVAAQDSSIITGGLQDNGGFTYNNNNWINYHGGDGMEGNVDPTNKSVHYGFLQYGGALFKTENNGGSISSRVNAPSAETGSNDSGGEWVTPMALNSNGQVFAGFKKLYKLFNGTWTEASSQSFSDDLDHIEINPNDDNNIFLAERSNLYRTTNGGLSFVQLNFNGGTINGIESSPEDTNTIWVVTNNGVYKSTNINSGSPTFQSIGSNLPSESKFVVKYHNRSGNNTIYLGTALGVYYLNDDSNEWKVFDNNLPNVAVRDLDINEKDSKLYAGTYGRGVFVTDLPRVLLPKDVSVLSIANLESSINCGNTLAPTVVIKNEGVETITSLTVNYSYDGASAETFNWSGSLASLQTATFSLPEKTLGVSSHEIEIDVLLTDDAYIENNKLNTSFRINNSISDPLFINTFDTNDGSEDLLTTTEGFRFNVWQKGTPSGTLLKTAASGNSVYATSLSANYPNASTSILYSNCYDLSVISNPEISFQMAFDIENEWDYLVFEYSINSGNSWAILGDATSSNWYNSAASSDSSGVSNLPGKQWTGEGESTHSSGGTNATLREYSHDLSFIGSEKKVIFRFRLVSDAEVNEEGVVIDDFGIKGTVLSTLDKSIENNFTVYPNPSKDLFNLSWSLTGEAKITVYNYLGKAVFKSKNIKTNSYQVDLANQSKGLYFIRVDVDGKQAVKKVILE